MSGRVEAADDPPDPWTDVVTTALLGTGRRPLPADLPAAWAGVDPQGSETREPSVRVLDLAARHRTLVRAAPPAWPGPVASAVEPAPSQDRADPPERAVQLLGDLLVRPTPDLVNLWLEHAAAGGFGVPSAYWTRLARLAAHATAYDRTRLGVVFGARGRWFLGRNPEWRRLAADCEPGPPRGTRHAAAAPPSPETIRGRPAAIFDHPDPWPDEVVAAAYAVLGSGGLGRKARDYAARVGGRLPDRLYESVARAAEYYLLSPEATPAQRRLVKESFVIVEQAAFARLEIARAFRPEEEGRPMRRVPIPGI